MSLSALVDSMKQAFPGTPRFTETHVPDLTGKVAIVTGSNTGVGKEVAQILYQKNAKVFLMARSEDKTRKAMDDIRAKIPKSAGELDYIRLDLADMSTIKSTAQAFLDRSDRLDLLFNNAGVAYPGKGATTAQGYELQMGVNVLGPLLLTQLLTPILSTTAKRPDAAKDSVRIAWVSSSGTLGVMPSVIMPAVRAGITLPTQNNVNQYLLSKLGNYLHAAEWAARNSQATGVVCVSLNPGNLDSDLWRDVGPWTHWLLRKTVLFPQVYGAYTELFAATAREVTMENSGEYIAPWGRLHTMPKPYRDAVRSKTEGGNGIAREFWNWSEEQMKPFL